MSDEIDRWVRYMKDHPNTWKKVHTQFIDAQFEKSRAFVRRLLQEPNGKEKVLRMYNIRNEKGFSGLFSQR